MNSSRFTQLCRLCLETSAGILNIFETFQDSTIASILTQHFWFEITKDDGMPEWLCKKCWSQTKTFHQFCKRLELRHRNHLSSTIVVKVEKTEPERSDADGPMEITLESETYLDKSDEAKHVGDVVEGVSEVTGSVKPVKDIALVRAEYVQWIAESVTIIGG